MPPHRRASSIGRYAPVNEPGDITDSYTSGAMTPSMRRMSGFATSQTTIHVGRTSADDELDDDELEGDDDEGDDFGGGKRFRREKDGGFANPSASSPMLPGSRVGAGAGAAWRSVDGTRYRSGGRNWGLRAKIVAFVLVTGALGGLGYFLYIRNRDTFQDESFEEWWHRFELENYVPEWMQGSEHNATTTTTTTTTTTSGGPVEAEFATDESEQAAPQRASSWSKALDAILERPTASATFGRWGRPTATASSAATSADGDEFEDYSEGDELSTDEAGNRHDWTVSSSYKDSSSSSASDLVGKGRFADSVGEEVLQLASNGTLSAYKWHETLPSLAGATSSTLLKSASKADGSGRLIVVGDLHGTHRSLVSLLHGVSYSTSRDILLHTGDVVTKSTFDDSLRTLALLRQYGAKGVRGNNDQKVLEWRKWMEAYGPMPLPVVVVSNKKPVKAAAAAAAGSGARQVSPSLKAEYRPLHGGAPKYGGRNAPAPRRRVKKAKRSWLSWFTGSGEGEDVETSQDELSSSFSDEDEIFEEEAFDTVVGSSSGEESVNTAAEAASTASDVAAAASGTPDRSWRSRPTPNYRVSAAAAVEEPSNGGDLLGPEYAYLSSDLSATEREQLGLAIPEGWEWGSEHFELAKRLTTADVEYLEGLPLTMWVEDLKSWVVHAGMVPWSSLRRTLARVSSSSSSSSSNRISAASNKFKPLPELLDSASGLTFSPSSSSLARQLAESSTRTALLLEQANTEPFTLLNMRTLSRTGSSASSRTYTSSGKLTIKGPPSEWTVSSKGRKASKNSQPWWSVWEGSMQDCAVKADEDELCEEAGVIYGHWAGQGLQVQDHSIGLDSGCVYGRRLSALVVPIGNGSSSSTSPLGKALIAPPTEKLDATNFAEPESSSTLVSSFESESESESESEQVVDSASEEEEATEQPSGATSVRGSAADAAAAARPNSQPNWHGGLNRVKLSPPGSSSSVAAAAADDEHDSDSTSEEETDSSGAEENADEEEEEKETRPWWRPWLRLRAKRAPPQGRPGIAPWESAILSRDDERSAVASRTGSSSSAPTTTTAGEGGSRFLKKLHTSPSTTSTSGKQYAAAAVDQDQDEDEDDEDEEEDARIASPPAAALKGDKEASGSNLLREQQVVLAQAREINNAYVVSVDCSGELAYQI